MKKLLILCLIGLSFKGLKAEDNKSNTNKNNALKFSLNESGSHYFQATFLNQVWLRYNQSNPGTLSDGMSKNETFDIGLRRTRVQMFGQLTDKVFIYFQFGQNNFNALYNSSPGLNRKNAAFMHDAVCEYKVSKNNALKIGSGLTIANGLSRFSQPSISSIVTMDVPVFAQATVDQIDQFSRKLSLYARGQVKHIDYRFSLSDPFPLVSNGAALSPASVNSNFATKGNRYKQYQSYIMWQFFDHENHTTPYMTGTYLGKKKIFNIAAGAIYQKNALWNRASANDSIAYQDLKLFCVESFLDMPLNKEKGTAISAYAGYFKTDYGKNYLRYNGIMNPANGSSLKSTNSISGQGPTYGNALPMFGTGSQIYTQVAYLMPQKLLGEHGQLMPYASACLSKFDRLQGKAMNVYNAGINWLINGHQSKISIDWQNRPTYYLDNNGAVNSGTRKNTFTVQYQIFI